MAGKKCKLVQLLWKSIWKFLRKLGIVLSQDPAIPLLSIYPKDAPSSHKDTCSTMFIAALFIISRNWTKEQIKKMWFIYTVEYYSAIKNKDILNFSGKSLELENIILSEIS